MNPSQKGRMNSLRRFLLAVLRSMRWIGSRELSTLIFVLLLAGGLWGFVELADTVREGEARAIDRRILLGLREADDLANPLGPKWLEETGRDLTALGGMSLLSLISLAVAGFLFLVGKWRVAIFLVVSVGGAFAASLLLKLAFDRPRPDLVPHAAYVYTSSFPSAHAMTSAATFLTLGALLARVHRDWRIKAYFLSVAVFVTVVVGISRVYLGVHWPTDVLAGWTLGACWSIGCWLIALRLQDRGELEGEGHPVKSSIEGHGR